MLDGGSSTVVSQSQTQEHYSNTRQQQQQNLQQRQAKTPGQNHRPLELQSWRSTDCVLDGGSSTVVSQSQTQEHYSNTRQQQQQYLQQRQARTPGQNHRPLELQSWRSTDCVLDGGSSTVVSQSQTQEHYSNTRQQQQQYLQQRQAKTPGQIHRPLESWRSTDCVLDGGSSTVVSQSQTQEHYSNTRQQQQQYLQQRQAKTPGQNHRPLESWRSTDCVLDGGSSTVVSQSQTQDHYSNTRQQQQQYLQQRQAKTPGQNHRPLELQSWRSTDCVLDGGSSTVVSQSQTQDHYSNTIVFHLQPRQERSLQSPKEQDMTYRGSTDQLSLEGGHVPAESSTPDHDNYFKWGPGATRTRPTQLSHQQPRLTNIPGQSPTGNKVRGPELQSWRSTDCVLDGGSNSSAATPPDHYRNTRTLQQNYQQPRQEPTPGQKHTGLESHCWRSADCLLEAGCNSLVAPPLDQRSNTKAQHQQPREERSPGQYSGSCEPQSRGSTTCPLSVSTLDPCSNTMSPRWQQGQEQYRQPEQEQYRQPGQEQYRQPGQEQYRQPGQEQFRQPGQEHFRQLGQEQFRQRGQEQYRKPRKEQSHLQLDESPYRRITECLSSEGSKCPVESPPDHYTHSSWEQGILNSRPQHWHKHQHQRTGRTPVHKPTGHEPRSWRSTDRLLEEDRHADVASPPELNKYPTHGSGGTCRLPPLPQPYQQEIQGQTTGQSPTGPKPRGHELQAWRSTRPQQHQDQQTRLTRIPHQSSRGWEPLSPRSRDCQQGGSSALLDSSLDPYGNTKQVSGAMSSTPQQQQYQQPRRIHASLGQCGRDLDHRHSSSTGCLLEEVSNALVTSTQGPNNLTQTIRPQQQRYQQLRPEITLHQSPTSREPQTRRSTDSLDGRGSKAPVVSSHLPHKYTNHGSSMSSLPPTQLQVPQPTIHRSPMHSPRNHKIPPWRSLDCLLEEGHSQDTYNDVSQDTGSVYSTSPCPQPRDAGRVPHWLPHPPKKHTYAAWGTRHLQDSHCK